MTTKSSKYQGVTYDRKKKRPWRAFLRISVAWKTKKDFKFLGCFEEEKLAARARDFVFIQYYPERSSDLNSERFPDDDLDLIQLGDDFVKKWTR